MRILILGHTGMLGHMVHKYLTSKSLNVETTNQRWPSQEFKEFIKEYDGDFIINCIGAIHQKTKNFDVNWELPIFLDFYCKCKIINPGTDCEMYNDDYEVETILSSECISKKEILDSINIVFNRKINIIEKTEISFNKCLDGGIITPHIKEQLFKLKDFYYG
jgi:hypothetical protein